MKEDDGDVVSEGADVIQNEMFVFLHVMMRIDTHELNLDVWCKKCWSAIVNTALRIINTADLD